MTYTSSFLLHKYQFFCGTSNPNLHVLACGPSSSLRNTVSALEHRTAAERTPRADPSSSDRDKFGAPGIGDRLDHPQVSRCPGYKVAMMLVSKEHQDWSQIIYHCATRRQLFGVDVPKKHVRISGRGVRKTTQNSFPPAVDCSDGSLRLPRCFDRLKGPQEGPQTFLSRPPRPHTASRRPTTPLLRAQRVPKFISLCKKNRPRTPACPAACSRPSSAGPLAGAAGAAVGNYSLLNPRHRHQMGLGGILLRARTPVIIQTNHQNLGRNSKSHHDRPGHIPGSPGNCWNFSGCRGSLPRTTSRRWHGARLACSTTTTMGTRPTPVAASPGTASGTSM